MINESATDQEISRNEWMLVAAILVLGAVLRILFVGSFHVEHFDEGVYASNRWFLPEEGARYPDRHLYAPPLWSAVLEYSQLLLGPTALGVMLPGICCGTLAIVFLWRLLRCWVGRQEALLVAGALSMSGFHILFSRTSLTDVPVTMLMLCGIGMGWSSLSRASRPMSVAAGIFTGLAWSVKYNGWFPLAVTGAGLAAANLFHVKQCGVLFKQWGCWLLIAVVAAIVWFPAWWDLQSPARGGYAAVATNHAGYLTGWENWREQFRIQFGNLGWFDDFYTTTGLLVLLVLLVAVNPRLAVQSQISETTRLQKVSRWMPLIVVVALTICGGLMGRGVSLPRIWLSLTLFGMGVRFSSLIRTASQREPVTPRILSSWMALAWVTSLLLMTPLYRPYPRLALPLFFALLVGAAFGLRELRRLFHTEVPDADPVAENQYDVDIDAISGSVSRGTRRSLYVWGLASLLISHILAQPPVISLDEKASPWQNRLAMETASQQIVDVCNAQSRDRLSRPVAYLLYVYGEPALYYHLCRLAPENVVVAPVANLGFLNDPPGREPVPIFLVSGPHTARDSSYLEQKEQAGKRLIFLHDFEVKPSDLLLLNAHSPEEIAESRQSLSEMKIELLQMNRDLTASRE